MCHEVRLFFPPFFLLIRKHPLPSCRLASFPVPNWFQNHLTLRRKAIPIRFRRLSLHPALQDAAAAALADGQARQPPPPPHAGGRQGAQRGQPSGRAGSRRRSAERCPRLPARSLRGKGLRGAGDLLVGALPAPAGPLGWGSAVRRGRASPGGC